MRKSDIIVMVCMLGALFGGCYIILGGIGKQAECHEQAGVQFFDPYTWECKNLK